MRPTKYLIITAAVGMMLTTTACSDTGSPVSQPVVTVTETVPAQPPEPEPLKKTAPPESSVESEPQATSLPTSEPPKKGGYVDPSLVGDDYGMAHIALKQAISPAHEHDYDARIKLALASLCGEGRSVTYFQVVQDYYETYTDPSNREGLQPLVHRKYLPFNDAAARACG